MQLYNYYQSSPLQYLSPELSWRGDLRFHVTGLSSVGVAGAELHTAQDTVDTRLAPHRTVDKSGKIIIFSERGLPSFLMLR